MGPGRKRALWLAALVAAIVPISFAATRFVSSVLDRSPQACVSQVSVRAPAEYTTAADQARQLACQRLAGRIPGFQIAVAVHGRLVWSEGFGYADLERHAPITAETQFRIGSVSKPLTADAVVQLVDAHRLDLDAPVQRYLPSFPDKGAPITTRLLAGHLAGIRHYQGGEFHLNRHFATVTDGLVIFKGDSLVAPPGTKFSYSTYGWNLISAVVEGAADQDFLTYMQRHVFAPLGMAHTVADKADSIILGRTRFYERERVTGAYRVAPVVDNSYKWAGGGFLSTAEDLVRFGSAHLAPGHLPAASLDLLFTSQRTNTGQETGYGVGWFLRTDGRGHRVAYHGGGSVGGTTAFLVDRDAGIVFALTSNLTDAPLDRVQEIPQLFER